MVCRQSWFCLESATDKFLGARYGEGEQEVVGCVRSRRLGLGAVGLEGFLMFWGYGGEWGIIWFTGQKQCDKSSQVINGGS